MKGDILFHKGICSWIKALPEKKLDSNKGSVADSINFKGQASDRLEINQIANSLNCSGTDLALMDSGVIWCFFIRLLAQVLVIIIGF